MSAVGLVARIRDSLRHEGVAGLADMARRRLGWGAPGRPPVEVALQEVVRQPGFTIVQLGAHCGDAGDDPLWAGLAQRQGKREGRILLVEPVREFYDKLVANYRDFPEIACANVAVSDTTGPATFYRLGVDPVAHGYPEWLSQLGSLLPERMTDLFGAVERIPEYQAFYLEHRIEETVQCVTLDELLAEHGLEHLDLLQMDVEGAELRILRTMDLHHRPARFVNYESALLGDAQAEARGIMRRHGYRLASFGPDTFCYRPADARLAARWRVPWTAAELGQAAQRSAAAGKRAE